MTMVPPMRQTQAPPVQPPYLLVMLPFTVNQGHVAERSWHGMTTGRSAVGTDDVVEAVRRVMKILKLLIYPYPKKYKYRIIQNWSTILVLALSNFGTISI